MTSEQNSLAAWPACLRFSLAKRPSTENKGLSKIYPQLGRLAKHLRLAKQKKPNEINAWPLGQLGPYRWLCAAKPPSAPKAQPQRRSGSEVLICGSCPFFRDIGAFPVLVGHCRRDPPERARIRDEDEPCDKEGGR